MHAILWSPIHKAVDPVTFVCPSVNPRQTTKCTHIFKWVVGDNSVDCGHFVWVGILVFQICTSFVRQQWRNLCLWHWRDLLSRYPWWRCRRMIVIMCNGFALEWWCYRDNFICGTMLHYHPIKHSKDHKLSFVLSIKRCYTSILPSMSVICTVAKRQKLHRSKYLYNRNMISIWS